MVRDGNRQQRDFNRMKSVEGSTTSGLCYLQDPEWVEIFISFQNDTGHASQWAVCIENSTNLQLSLNNKYVIIRLFSFGSFLSSHLNNNLEGIIFSLISEKKSIID